MKFLEGKVFRTICISTGAIAVVLHVVFLWVYPMNISPDSTFYLDGARHLAEEGRFVAFNENLGNPEYSASDEDIVKPILDFPPGYSAMISVPMRLFGAEMFPAAKTINCCAYLVLISCWVWVFATLLGVSSFEFAAATLFLGIDSGVVFFLNLTLSEMLFASCLAVMSAGVLVALKERPRCFWVGTSMIALAGSVAVLTRNAGVGLLPGVAFGVWVGLLRRGEGIPKASMKALVPCLIAAAAFGFWCWRNLQFGGQAVFLASENESATRIGVRFLEIVAWFFAAMLGMPVRIESAVFTLPTIAGLAGWWHLRRSETARKTLDVGAAWLPAVLGSYCGMIVLAGMMSDVYNAFSGFVRYFYPMQPVFLGAMLLVWKFREEMDLLSVARRLTIPAIAIVLLLALAGGMKRQVFIMRQQTQRVDLVATFSKAIAEVPAESVLISNDARRFAVLTGRDVRQVDSADDIRKLSPELRMPGTHLIFSLIGENAENMAQDLGEYSTVLREDDRFVLARVDKALAATRRLSDVER